MLPQKPEELLVKKLLEMGGSEIARLRYEVTDEGYREDHNQIGVRLLDGDLKHLNHYGSYCRIFPRERLEKVGVMLYRWMF